MTLASHSPASANWRQALKDSVTLAQKEITMDEKPEADALPHLAVVPQEAGWMRIIDKMIDKGVPVEQLKALFDMQQQWEKEQARKAFIADFVAFKAEAPTAIERTKKVSFPTKAGGQMDYTHVELDKAVSALVPVLSKYNLSHSWDISDNKEGLITVTCRIEHIQGHFKTVTLSGMPDASGSKNPIQAKGSTAYYLERYTFLAAVGMAQSDGDDDVAGANGGGLSPDQIGEINDLILTAEHVKQPVNYVKMFAWLGVEYDAKSNSGIGDAWSLVPGKRYNEIVKMLKGKIEKGKAK